MEALSSALAAACVQLPAASASTCVGLIVVAEVVPTHRCSKVLAYGALFALTACTQQPESAVPVAASSAALRDFRRSEVDQWLSARSRGWNIVQSATMPSGQIIDFVDVNTLTQGQPAATPPQQTPSDYPVVGGDGPVTEYEAVGMQAPAGTVPVARPALTGYIEQSGEYPTLGAYLMQANPMPIAPPDQPLPMFANDRLYTSHTDQRDHISNAGDISLWDFQQVATGEMSLMQAASLCWDPADFSNTMESIEAGFQKQPGMYGDNSVHFFTYFRTAGASVGPLVGGYDELTAGFQRNMDPSVTLFPGAVIDPSALNAVGDGSHYCPVEIQLFSGQWWVFACGQWVGYYPGPSSPDSADKQIAFNRLANHACRADWYGEYSQPGIGTGTPAVQWTQGDLGNGLFGTDPQAAWIRNPRIGLTSFTDVSNLQPALTPTTAIPGYDPNCYTMTDMLVDDATRLSYFRMGGPGADNPGCN